MYTGLLHSHSLLRWIMLILLIITVVRAYSAWKSGRSFNAPDKKLSLLTLIVSHLRLILGFGLYLVSPIVQSALSNMGAAMKDKMLRFWAVEHVTVMVLAIALITVGHILSKKASTDQQKFKRIFIWFLTGLILILISIPWPFMQIGAGRGWL